MTTIVFFIGLAAITAGAFMIFTPAGFVVGGLLLAGSAYLYESRAPEAAGS